MAQHDYIIANQSGAAFRSDLNNGLAAAVSNNSGAAQPSTTYAYMWWPDTTTGLLKIRNAANNGWVTVGTLADAGLGLLSLAGGTMTGALLLDDSGTVSLPALAFDGDPNTGIWRSAADTINVATNGVENIEFGTSEVVVNDGGADIDFRIEGDTKANLFKVDAGADTVSVDGTAQLANQTPLRLGDSDNSHYVALRSPATVTTNVTWDLPATDGTADQALVTNGSGVLSFASRSRLVSGTSVASTSGASIDFTGIPSWAKRVMVMFNGVSTNGSATILIQLGAGSFVTSGYLGTGATVSDSNATAVTIRGGGLAIDDAVNAVAVRYGSIMLANITGNTWVGQAVTGRSDNAGVGIGAGSIALSGSLDRVRITTTNGTDTFDAGTINIMYED